MKHAAFLLNEEECMIVLDYYHSLMCAQEAAIFGENKNDLWLMMTHKHAMSRINYAIWDFDRARSESHYESLYDDEFHYQEIKFEYSDKKRDLCLYMNG